MNAIIREASGERDYMAVAQLISDYVAWLGLRYQEDTWIIAEVLDRQSLSSELDILATMYGPPHGRAFVAVHGSEIRACGAFRRIDSKTCEMKRVFVPERFRGNGLGRRLCSALIASAREDGYRSMKLDTGNLMQEAIAMYRSLGFRECAPYIDYPEKLLPYFMFMELRLADANAS